MSRRGAAGSPLVSTPLIALDVFEHAYYHKDGPGRATYIDNFLNNLHWGRINERFLKCGALCAVG